MNSKGHLYCSVAKSMLRLIGCFISALLVVTRVSAGAALCTLAVFFSLAEILGILEEILDMR